MNHIGTQTIRTKRLLLRRFTPADAGYMFANWANDPQVTKYLTWSPHGQVEATEKLLELWCHDYEKPDHYQWAIVYENQPIGSVAVVRLRDAARMGEVGYCIGKNWWHMGIMTEALEAVMAFLFEKAGFNCIAACHAPENPHSGDVMKKCGMHCDGTLRAHGRNNQGICDEVYYSLLRQEWYERHNESFSTAEPADRPKTRSE